jgi:hypothetical protein
MGGFLTGLISFICVLVLVALFFPFRFRAEFEAGEHGGKVRLFFFKKKLWSGKKKWGREKRDAKAHENDRDLDSDIVDDDEAFMPESLRRLLRRRWKRKPHP